MQVLQDSDSFHHLVDGIRTQQVVVDHIQPLLVGTLITLRPFLRIADRTDATQVYTGNQVSLIVFLYQIRKRHVRRIAMMVMAPHYQRESPDTRRPQDIGVTGRLGTSLHNTLVDGAQLIHMVTLVRAASGVQKRIHAGNQQTALMHRHSKRSCKDSTSLSVLKSAVAEQK